MATSRAQTAGAWDDSTVRVRRSFAFIDLSGFSALTERQGDERAVALLGGFRTLVREICSRRGVRIAKWLGDGAMLVGVETEPLVATALELQYAASTSRTPVKTTCGLTTGAVLLLEGDDYIGHAVNVAARLCDLAAPSQILAAEPASEHLPPWGQVARRTEVLLRGLDSPLTVLELALRPPEGDSTEDPICGLPLTARTATATSRDRVGRVLLFCSESCRETWESRPRPAPDEQGSLRVPLIGS